MKNNKKIQRLILYRHSLVHFKSLGFQNVFSYNIARHVGVSPEQVRKDFSEFNIKGNKKAGYSLDDLLSQLDRIFQKNKQHNVIIVGIGNIGNALVNYQGFRNRGIIIKSAFDNDVNKFKQNYPIPVYPLEYLPNFVKMHHVRIAILSTTLEAAQDVTDLLVDSGIKGIMNFTYANLRVPGEIHVMDISLTDTLESLVFLANQ